MMTQIKHWPEHERPRERLFKTGPASLSDRELLAINLGSGIAGKSAVELAGELLNAFGSLRGVLSAEDEQLLKFRGLGKARLAFLRSLAEIIRRYLKYKSIEKSYILDPSSVRDYLLSELQDRKKEVFKILFLDKANRLIGEKDISFGTVDQAVVYPREIVYEVLLRHACGIVLVHNHPSGRVEPSREDRLLTEKIREVCELLSIALIDHLIIGDGEFFSFRESGILS